jgi:hypothetical protein
MEGYDAFEHSLTSYRTGAIATELNPRNAEGQTHLVTNSEREREDRAVGLILNANDCQSGRYRSRSVLDATQTPAAPQNR